MTLRNDSLRFPDESYVTSGGSRGSHPIDWMTWNGVPRPAP